LSPWFRTGKAEEKLKYYRGIWGEMAAGYFPKSPIKVRWRFAYKGNQVYVHSSPNLLIIIASAARIRINHFSDHLEVEIWINDGSLRRIKGFHVNLGRVLEILIANLLLDIIRRAADGNLAAIFLLWILCIALIPIGTYIRRRFPVS